MYHTIVARISRANFEKVNVHDYDGLLADCVPNIHHQFGGSHALGGERHDREHLKLWFERLGRLVPTLRLDVTDIWVKGWPWNTHVFIRWTATESEPLPDGSAYYNRGLHAIILKWGKVHSIDAHEDSQAVARQLALKAQAGMEEATAAPIIS